MNKKLIAAIAVVLTIALSAALCACKKAPAGMVDSVTLNFEKAVTVVGDGFDLTATVAPAAAADITVSWASSDTDVVTVDSAGKCTAVGAGEATVTATSTDGAKTAECKVYIGDIVVNRGDEGAEETAAAGEENNGEDERSYYGGTLDATLFRTIAGALQAITEPKTVIVVEADYGEAVTAGTSVTLIGVGSPSLKSFSCTANNAEIVLKNLAFRDIAYPEGGSASVVIPENASAKITECVFSIESTEELEGGYAILVGKQSKNITIEDCSVANYRYGIYVNPTDQEINIKDNSFSNLKVGIGVDIRQENSDPPANYPTTGAVGGNEYNEVETNTQFFHYGETFDGDFDFADFEDQTEIGDGDITD